MKAALALASMVALVACRKEPTAQPATPVELPAQPTPPADASPFAGNDELKAHMQKHFATVLEIERAIVAGDLGAAQSRARWLRSHREPAVLDAWRPHVEALYAAAERLEKAPDLSAAAVLAAMLAGECGACHQSTRAITTFEWTPEPPPGTALPAIMRRHQWASERLWEGLVGPSDARWLEGSEMLAELAIDAEGHWGHLPEADAIRASASQLRTIAAEASKTLVPKERVRLYGELLNSCIGCHSRARRPK